MLKLKFQIFLIAVLMSCIAFMSCERAQQMVGPVMPEADTMEPGDMVKPDDTMEPGDIVEPDGMVKSGDMTDMPDMADPSMEAASVVINELMADNDNTIVDPQGDYDDWLELYNLTDSAVLLTGMYLSDKEDNLTKWEFPENTEISANGYLVVWLDEDHDDENATEGLHANFKLSKSGETVILVGTDAHGNRVLDRVTFEEQKTDVALGRLPNGTGDFQIVQATPGAPNMAN
ncbi:MAG: lamin tail domain-containing protein [Candidatus Poribacteria bacterium]|nr:lamin tail domain-containing protein [Candidatus Poribacteria bacterium]MDE0327047.1 lamin tail domain-containing protein [Candidatus Poribacteria bacterium]